MNARRFRPNFHEKSVVSFLLEYVCYSDKSTKRTIQIDQKNEVEVLQMAVKRVLNVFLVWCMLTSLVSFGWVPNQVMPEVLQTGEAQAAQAVNIGDYIQFGKYNNAPILWRVIHRTRRREIRFCSRTAS